MGKRPDTQKMHKTSRKSSVQSEFIRVRDIAEIVFHLHPQESTSMLRQLLRRKNIYQSSRRVNLRQGRLDDPETQVAEQDNLFLVGRPTTYEHAPAFRSFFT